MRINPMNMELTVNLKISYKQFRDIALLLMLALQ